eukprot:m.450196 g.450196  ORF g.450196 m.450196 type:complete len:319 (+) comp56908_c0_seq11:125-1081(+)
MRVRARRVALLLGGAVVCLFLYAQLVHHDEESLPEVLNVLSESDALPRATLLVMIMSSVGGQPRRQAIRKTWAHHSFGLEQVRVFFVIGTHGIPSSAFHDLEEEHMHHGDLALIADLEDAYSKLTNKLIAGLTWSETHFAFDYLFKGDDDTFIRLDVLVPEILAMAPDPRLYWGYFDGRAEVKRSGQWKESSWFLCDRYLPYALGGGYILGSDLVAYVVRNSKLFNLYNSEDVSMGTWLAPIAATRRHDIRFDTEWMAHGCLNSLVVLHKQSPEDMKKKYSNLEASGGQRLCDSEFVFRKFYTYNWQAPPSQCCTDFI